MLSALLRRMAWPTAVALVVAAAVPACGSQPLRDNGGGSQDDNGFGDPCARPNDGCPCNPPGQQVDCGYVQQQYGDYVTCAKGQRTCDSDGKWGACVAQTNVVKSTAPIGGGDIHTLSLGGNANCTGNPCDPTCQNYNTDSCAGVDAGAGLSCDGGLSLSGTPTNCITPTVTLTGKVYDPAALNPVYGVSVSVPANGTPAGSSPPPAFTPANGISGIPANTCGGTAFSALVATTTDTNGNFTLSGVPLQTTVYLVMQIGRWRRTISLNTTSCTCTGSPASPQTVNLSVAAASTCLGTTYSCAGASNYAGTANCMTRLPRKNSEGNIPQIAIGQGTCDSQECLLYRMGVDVSEFTDQNGSGKVHMFYNGSPQGMLQTANAAQNDDISILEGFNCPYGICGPLSTTNIGNPGFEAGTGSWTKTGADVTSDTAYTTEGSQSVRLGKNNAQTNGDNTISQTFTAPAGASRLLVDAAVRCKDTANPHKDWFSATLTDNTSGYTSSGPANICDNTGGFHTLSFWGVVPGDSYTLTLTNHDDNDATYPTWTWVDKVRWSTSGNLDNPDFESGGFAGWSYLPNPTNSGWEYMLTASSTNPNGTTPEHGTYSSLLGYTSTASKSIDTGVNSAIRLASTAPAGAATLSFWALRNCQGSLLYDGFNPTWKDNTGGSSGSWTSTCSNDSSWQNYKLTGITPGHNYTLALLNHANFGNPNFDLYFTNPWSFSVPSPAKNVAQVTNKYYSTSAGGTSAASSNQLIVGWGGTGPCTKETDSATTSFVAPAGASRFTVDYLVLTGSTKPADQVQVILTDNTNSAHSSTWTLSAPTASTAWASIPTMTVYAGESYTLTLETIIGQFCINALFDSARFDGVFNSGFDTNNLTGWTASGPNVEKTSIFGVPPGSTTYPAIVSLGYDPADGPPGVTCNVGGINCSTGCNFGVDQVTSQTFYAPPGSTQLSLDYYVWVGSSSISDNFTVVLTDSTNGAHSTSYSQTAPSKSSAWATIPFTVYAGEQYTITLKTNISSFCIQVFFDSLRFDAVPGPTWTFVDNVQWLDGANNPLSPIQPSSLVNNYDMLLLPCSCGSEYGSSYWDLLNGDFNDDVGRTNLVNFANAGGRIFSSHWGREWIERSSYIDPGTGATHTDSNPNSPPFASVANWYPVNFNAYTNTTAAGWYESGGTSYGGTACTAAQGAPMTAWSASANTTTGKCSIPSAGLTGYFDSASGNSRVQNFASWMGVVNGGNTSTMTIATPGQTSEAAVSVNTTNSVRFVYADSDNVNHAPPDLAQDFTFETPIGATASGRVLFTDMHLSAASTNTSSTFFPAECNAQGTALSAQELAWEYLFFDLGNCVAGQPPPVTTGTTFSASTFTRDFQGVCPAGMTAVWHLFNWTGTTPSTTSLNFVAWTADSQSQLQTQTGLTNGAVLTCGTGAGACSTTGASGPAICACSTTGGPCSSSVNPLCTLGTCSSCYTTNGGSQNIDVETLLKASVANGGGGAATWNSPPIASHGWLRVAMTLNPNSGASVAPTLTTWTQTYDCVAAQ